MDREKLKQLNQELADKQAGFENSTSALRQEIKELKESCTHQRYVYEYDSNTGNYDPSDDCYWINIECLDCEMKKTFFDDVKDYNYWSKRYHVEDVELALERQEYKLIKDKGLL